jgi:hypothetical protein
MLFSSGVFDVVEPGHAAPSLPLRLALTPDRTRTTARLCLIVPGLLALLVPAALAAYLLIGPGAQSGDQSDQLTSTALTLLPALWLGLAAMSALAILPRMARKRLVTITSDQVSALETSLLGVRAWRLPIREYRGIAHHVRASSGIVNHEIILVHPNPDRSVLLHTALVVNQTSLDHFAALFRLPLVPARDVYRLHLPALALPAVLTGREALAVDNRAS